MKKLFVLLCCVILANIVQAETLAITGNPIITDTMKLIADFDFNSDPVDGVFTGGGAKAVTRGTPAFGTNPFDGSRSVLMTGNATSFRMDLYKEDGSPLLAGLTEFAISYDVLSNAATTNDWVFYAARNVATPKADYERYLAVRERTDNIEIQRWYNVNEPAPPIINVLAADGWRQVVIVFSEYSTKVYVNGVLTDTTISEHSVEKIISRSGGARLRLGWNWSNSDVTNFNGQIDNFRVWTLAPPATDEAKVAAAKEALELRYGIVENQVRGNIHLPEVGLYGTRITWTTSHPDIVDVNRYDIENYDPRLPGMVTRPADDTVVTMMANISSGAVSDTKEFRFTVRATPAPLDEKEAYLFVTFTGVERRPTDEQIYFALSKDMRTFTDMTRSGNPVLRSTQGDLGVRDPYLIRSPEGDKFYLIATDLNIHLRGGWGGHPQGPGTNFSSTHLAVWESYDLVNWSDMWLVDVAGCILEARMAWAPEVVYDAATGDYFVFWASGTNSIRPPNVSAQAGHFMFYARTRDFRTFSPATLWITSEDGSREIIDTTAILANGFWYRSSKECYAAPNRGDRTTVDRSRDFVTVQGVSYPSLTGEWDRRITTLQEMFPGLHARLGALEGAQFFLYNERDWVDGKPTFGLIADRYSHGAGYHAFYTTDLDSTLSVANGGAWNEATIDMGPVLKRHGHIFPITKAEHDAIMEAFYERTGDQ